MKRLLITAAMAISLLTLLAACGGDGTDKENPNQETGQEAAPQTTGGGTPTETADTGKSNIVVLSGNDAIVDRDGQN